MAMGAATVSLCSTSDETIPAAEKDLPRNLCPLIKSSYGFAKTDKCPFFYFSDVVVGETTCDGKKKMYEYMGEFKEVFIMELPQSQKAEVLDLWKAEILRFKEYLEKKFEVTITEEQVREAVKLENEVRTSLKNLYGVMRHDPAPIKGHDLFRVLYGSGFKLDRTLIADEVDALTAKIEKEYAEGKREDKKPRILITGCPIGGATEKIIDAVENNGGIVVTFENCSGAKSIDRLIDEDAEDIYQAIAERYLSIGCSVMTPNPNRLELLGRLIDEYQVDGVVDMILSGHITPPNGLLLFTVLQRLLPPEVVHCFFRVGHEPELAEQGLVIHDSLQAGNHVHHFPLIHRQIHREYHVHILDSHRLHLPHGDQPVIVELEPLLQPLFHLPHLALDQQLHSQQFQLQRLSGAVAGEFLIAHVHRQGHLVHLPYQRIGQHLHALFIERLLNVFRPSVQGRPI